MSITASVSNGVHPTLSIAFKSMFLQILIPEFNDLEVNLARFARNVVKRDFLTNFQPQ